jgi:hypothetical protein
MRSRSAPGSSTPTWRRTNRLRYAAVALLAPVVAVVAAFYIFESFVASSPLLRIAMRTLPVLPVAVWTLWFEPSRPFERLPSLLRTLGRLVLLLIVMAFALALLGLGLNWLYDPRRVI